MLPRIQSVSHLGDYRLWLEFTDGTSGELDFRSRVLSRGGVFEPFADVTFFRQVQVDSESGTIVWPNGVDLCPDTLFQQVTHSLKNPSQPELVAMNS